MCCRQGVGVRWWFVISDGAGMSREMHPIPSGKTDFGWFTAFVSPRGLKPAARFAGRSESVDPAYGQSFQYASLDRS